MDGIDQRMSCITLGVEDIGRARAFYENLGWKAGKGSGPDVVFFQLNGFVFALFGRQALAEDSALPAGTLRGFPGFTLSYNVSDRADVAEVLTLAERSGATIVKPAGDTFWGGHHGCFTDLDGYVWEVAHNPFWTIDSTGNTRLPS